MVGTLASKFFKPEKKKSKFFSGLKKFEARVPTITTAAVYQNLMSSFGLVSIVV